MRKIDKKCSFSTVYKIWEEDLEKTETPHPKYNSSKGRYFRDIKMQLYHCQNGLCAYTEKKLCDKKLYHKKKWQKGRYVLGNDTDDSKGQLEHFDETLKAKKTDTIGRQDWLWDNLFMVESDVNTKIKGSKSVDYILKPDSATYNPFELLEYDYKSHQYLPHKNLDAKTKERVKNMISTLGLNFAKMWRKDYLNPILADIFLQLKTWDDIKVYQFPTAFEMCRKLLEDNELEILEDDDIGWGDISE